MNKNTDFTLFYNSMISYRKALHKIPELAFSEYKTNTFIQNFLRSKNVEYKEIAKTGIIAFIKGKNNRTIALRADMDALAIGENTGVPYSSKHVGTMHACGHDMHMAMLLGMIEYCTTLVPPVNVLFLFQPAEEGKGGAAEMLKEKVFSFYPKPDAIFGFHVYPDLPYGTIGCKRGLAWAGSSEFQLILRTHGGHGALPHKATDLLYIFSQWYASMQGLISRKKNPFETTVLTCGKLHGADTANVFSSMLDIGGTIRFFQESTADFLYKSMETCLKGLQMSFDFSFELINKSLYIPLHNNEKIYDQFAKKMHEKKELSFVFSPIEEVMVSEDFSYFLKEIPGLYFFLGVNSGKAMALHTPDFFPDEKNLLKGFDVYRFLLENALDIIGKD